MGSRTPAPGVIAIHVIVADFATLMRLEPLFKETGRFPRVFWSGEDFLDWEPVLTAGVVLCVPPLPGMAPHALFEELENRRSRHYGRTLPELMDAGGRGVTEWLGEVRKLLSRWKPASCSSRADLEHRAARLTPRERQVLEVLLRGNNNKATAALLGISSRTVEGYRASIYRKFGVRSLVELAALRATEKKKG